MKNKKSVYLTEQIIDELQTEASRQERSVSWLLQRAWLIARDQIKAQGEIIEGMNQETNKIYDAISTDDEGVEQ